jgi:tRNA pseudouridine38-40 synthase
MTQQEMPVQKIALGIEYDGSKYYGWQRQREVRSVQEKLEKALSQIAAEPIAVFCAGRTDAGVHGTGQVVHFETTARRKDAAWTLGVNANLPADIAVRWVKTVADDFHARFSATARRYRYIIYNHRLRPAVLQRGRDPLLLRRWTRSVCIGRPSVCWAKMILPRSGPYSASRAPPGAT